MSDPFKPSSAAQVPPVPRPEPAVRVADGPRPQSGLGDFLSFRRMITPIIIQIIFWIAIVGVVIGSFVAMQESPAGGIAILIFGPIVVRIYAELLMVIFRMNETLTDIRNNTRH
jgi:Domain of unknown function (DUF4282)